MTKREREKAIDQIGQTLCGTLFAVGFLVCLFASPGIVIAASICAYFTWVFWS